MPSNLLNLPVVRPIRPAPKPLGLYFRPGWNEHTDLLASMEAGQTRFFGAIFDPTHLERQKELRDQVIARRLDGVLDPRTQPSATIGGHTDALGALPWGVGRPHTISDFQGELQLRRTVGALGDFAADRGFTAILAPTHLIRSANDPWLAVDSSSVRFLRNHLDRRRGPQIPIFYSLAISAAAFRDPDQRGAIAHTLTGLPVSALWLKVDGFGANASPTATRIYLEALKDFHSIGIPIVADYVGGLVGLSVLAFGSVGGLAHGITNGEQFTSRSWFKPKKEGKGFSPSKRVYVPSIGMLLSPPHAKALIEGLPRSRALFGCGNPQCCPRGVTDMLQNPGRHFIWQRTEEVADLGRIPSDMRTQRFLDQHIRSTTDKALLAANMKWTVPEMAKKTQEHRKRLDNLRVTLGKHATESPPESFAIVPKTRAARES
jgi:hypothetical protein